MLITFLISTFLCTFASGQEEFFNSSIFASSFSDAIGRHLPYRWQNSNSLEQFRQDFANITKHFLDRVLVEHFVEAAIWSTYLFPIDTYSKRLTDSSFESLSSTATNELLTAINYVLHNYLSILNECNKTELKPLPSLPPFKPVKRKQYQLIDKFRKFREILDEQLSYFNDLFGNLYLEGWGKTRPVLYKVHIHYCKTFLYGSVLEKLVYNIRQVKAAQAKIQVHVQDDVWKKFTVSANQVLEIYEKFHKQQ